MNTLLIFDEDKKLKDIEVEVQAKKFLLLGLAGENRELSIYDNYIQAGKSVKDKLIVFIGLGLGKAIRKCIKENKDCKIAIVDKEEFLENPIYINEVKDILERENVYLIKEDASLEAIKKLILWRQENGNLDLVIFQNSQYFRIDRDYYKNIEKQIEIVQKDGFWSNFSLKPFSSKKIKVLFPLVNELIFDLVQACEQLGFEHKCLNIDSKSFDTEQYSNAFVDAITQFKPDMILTTNHQGIDQDGALIELAKKANLPIVSILLDSPYLMLSTYPQIRSDILSIFTYDADTVPLLKEMGYTYVDFLPLGTNKQRFHPKNKENPFPSEWISDISFVGASLRPLVFNTILTSKLPHILLRKYKEIARAFIQSKEHIVKDFIALEFQDVYTMFTKLDEADRLNFEKIIIWESTRQYRLACVEKTLDFTPAIIGDKNWYQNFKENRHKFRYLGSVPYAKIADFYTHTTISFNTTSMQMKNAVNQRIFDVPISNGFIITDWRSQMEELFDIGKEIIAYKDIDEIPDLIRYYLKNEADRNTIVEKGRKRILKEHTWDIRLQNIINIMSKRYS